MSSNEEAPVTVRRPTLAVSMRRRGGGVVAAVWCADEALLVDTSGPETVRSPWVEWYAKDGMGG